MGPGQASMCDKMGARAGWINRAFCCLQHCSFLSFEEQKNRGLSSCCFVNLAMLVQRVVRDLRQWSNKELNLVLHFHVSHCILWCTVQRTFMGLCKHCAVNMSIHSLHAFVEHPLPQSAMAFGSGLCCTYDSRFIDYNQFLLSGYVNP